MPAQPHHLRLLEETPQSGANRCDLPARCSRLHSATLATVPTCLYDYLAAARRDACSLLRTIVMAILDPNTSQNLRCLESVLAHLRREVQPASRADSGRRSCAAAHGRRLCDEARRHHSTTVHVPGTGYHMC